MRSTIASNCERSMFGANVGTGRGGWASSTMGTGPASRRRTFAIVATASA